MFLKRPGMEPVFLEKDRQPITRKTACFRSGQIRVLDANGNVERVIPFDETK
jgi:hypothetical protein